MVTNFEGITAPLSKSEKKLIPFLVKILEKHKKKNPIKAPDLCYVINKNHHKLGLEKEFREVTLRKLTHIIRCNSILPIIATQKGYYVSTDVIEIEKQIKSLQERATAILRSAEGLKKYKNNLK